jgi:hypothetical protein
MLSDRLWNPISVTDTVVILVTASLVPMVLMISMLTERALAFRTSSLLWALPLPFRPSILLFAFFLSTTATLHCTRRDRSGDLYLLCVHLSVAVLAFFIGRIPFRGFAAAFSASSTTSRKTAPSSA